AHRTTRSWRRCRGSRTAWTAPCSPGSARCPPPGGRPCSRRRKRDRPRHTPRRFSCWIGSTLATADPGDRASKAFAILFLGRVGPAQAGFPSGQRDLTVNQTAQPTGVRIPHPPQQAKRPADLGGPGGGAFVVGAWVSLRGWLGVGGSAHLDSHPSTRFAEPGQPTSAHNTGSASAHGCSASSWEANANRVGSDPRPPTNCTPSGRPPTVRYSGTDIAGLPVRLASWVNGTGARLARIWSFHALVFTNNPVSRSLSRASPACRSRGGVSSSPIRTGGLAMVGVNSRSYRSWKAASARVCVFQRFRAVTYSGARTARAAAASSRLSSSKSSSEAPVVR